MADPEKNLRVNLLDHYLTIRRRHWRCFFAVQAQADNLKNRNQAQIVANLWQDYKITAFLRHGGIVSIHKKTVSGLLACHNLETCIFTADRQSTLKTLKNSATILPQFLFENNKKHHITVRTII